MLNEITIMGRLTRDPEMRTTQSGTTVTSFTVACDRDYQKGGSEEKTDYIDCVAWKHTGEFVSKYWKKGQLIVVSGRLQSRKWEDRDGAKRTSWEVNANNVYFGGDNKKADAENTAFTAPKTVSAADFMELDDSSELPF